MRPLLLRLTPLFGVLVVIALTLAAYRALPSRPFAADDFQWLLGARALDAGSMVRAAFDWDQSHFFRPLVWVLFWLEARVFGLDPRGYHAVSLALHLANALLLGWLVWRLTNDQRPTTNDQRPTQIVGRWSLVILTAIVALHPAPFEAVVWVSAQSELLAAFWLLVMLHLWCSAVTDDRRLMVFGLLSTFALALALLTKESAVIGLPLLLLSDIRGFQRPSGLRITHQPPRFSFYVLRFTHYLLPTFLFLAYLALQLRVERENYLVDQGGYGIGPQLVVNPLRGLALLVLPLPGTERADGSWLVPLGALVALGLLLAFARGSWPARRAIAALVLTLLPTAPFVSPPDSRYLYGPMLAGAALVGLALAKDERRRTKDERRRLPKFFVVGRWLLVVGLALLATAELSVREARFGVATGAEGSLWRLASSVCAERTPDRVILLNPPIAEIHLRASLALACGDTITPIVVDTMEIAEANLELNSLIIDFPNGAARVARQT